MAGILDTQNQTWRKDESGFGFQMLQKMGWSEGKGLGANEDGMQKPIVLRRKLDTAGLGVQKIAADAWKAGAEVSASFDNVLTRLGAVGNMPQQKSPSEDATSGEDETVHRSIAKKSSRKVSYHSRRAKGKNVKSYSGRDLKEIFGGHGGSPAEEVEKTVTEVTEVTEIKEVGKVELVKKVKQVKEVKYKKRKDKQEKKSKKDKESKIKKQKPSKNGRKGKRAN
eukprot:CAMPEP_0198730378 /NCGR_PEP_ID=MMETSP1475-20131203/24301_1 /TAXON_ID= ORGANISM="Unidentified sp., Strain CCMP1999" /NCGR_SAMPLE_ID=MMETSP1475 /ASSEMBLY_ACC=CAM_ASM_001111 /LENGTH=223 /DNA_ID=CAMNT_0044493175 /DNA_START=27 /DNA_END=698 /DNA_ORIENTATION=-